jgi:hypothetical protein
MKENVPSRLRFLLILALIITVAAIKLKHLPNALAQQGPPPAPDLCFEHSRGQFKAVSFSGWQEYYDGKPTNIFVFKGDDSDFLYLFDKPRNVTLGLPKKGGLTRVKVGNGPWSNGYLVHACAGAKHGTIRCHVTNDGGFQNTYEMFDNVANQAIGDITLPPHGSTDIYLRSSGALNDGYGSFKDRIKGNQTWNNHDLIRDGENKSL